MEFMIKCEILSGNPQMIDLGSGNNCVCRKYNNTQGQCKDQYTISEQGKSVKLVPKLREQVIAIILDGCLLQDNDTKCDALFLYKRLSLKNWRISIKFALEVCCIVKRQHQSRI